MSPDARTSWCLFCGCRLVRVELVVDEAFVDGWVDPADRFYCGGFVPHLPAPAGEAVA